MYSFVDAATLRAAINSSTVDIPSCPDVTGSTDADVAAWQAWLRQVWAWEEYAAAVEVASPALARRVRQVCDGRRLPVRQLRRVVLSVLRYLLRATFRATPFGLFAGVATARIDEVPTARFGREHRVVARVDGVWLAEVITRLESVPELRQRLLVADNALAFVRDDRLVLACQRQPGSGDLANGPDAEPAEVSVRHTAAVRTVMHAARAPIHLGDLAAKLATDFPDTPEPVIDAMLAELVARRFLLSCLHPPMTVTDPLGHLVDALTAVGTDTVPDAAVLLGELRAVRSDLTRHDQAPAPAKARALRATATARMIALAATDRPLAVDIRLDADVTLPPDVAREAEAAAAVLVRLAPYPTGTAAWQDYHGRFIERYGPAALVPVAELVDPDIGLGFPAGYRDTHLPAPAQPGLSDRDAAMLAMAQDAALRQDIEVVLDDRRIADLAVASVDVDAATVQPTTELRVRVHAPSLAALEQGEFELAVVGVSRAAGTTTGRFLDLLDLDDRERMRRAYTHLPAVSEYALAVQVSCPGLYPRADNVSRTLAVLPHRLSLAEYASGGTGTLLLDDLAVTADPHRLCLLSLSQRRPVEPLAFSAVELINHTHPLARFLCELPTARTAACAPFSWGAAHRLPFLPRVRYRRSILAPARWLLAAADLPGQAASRHEWSDALAAWRDRYRVPTTVLFGDSDRRIRLDLDDPAHHHLLRSELDRAGQAALRETPDPGAFGWIGGRAHEIVLPLAATAAPVPRRTWPSRTVGREHGHLPGAGDWLYVKLYGHPDRQTAIITAHLPRLLSTLDGPPPWWVLRYHDPEPHLRLRIKPADSHAIADTLQRVGAWADELRRRGLLGRTQTDTYYPETGRFGHGAAMAAAETVFAADSAATFTQLAAAGHRVGPHPHALIAASMVDLAIGVTGSTRAGMRWLIDHARTSGTAAPPRRIHEQAVRLGNPRDEWAALRTLPGGETITDAWLRRRAALAAYRAVLTTAGEITLDTLLPDLLHLHHVRMTGVNVDTERACLHLARAAALSWTTRTGDAP